MNFTALTRGEAGQGLPSLMGALLGRYLNGWTGGRVIIDLPGGQKLSFGDADGPQIAITIRSPRALWRLAASGGMGCAEGYVAGEWDTPDLSAFLTLAARNLDIMERGSPGGTLAARVFHRFMHTLRANTRAGSRRNIAAHYDLGNAFYGLWLGPGMTYSSAIFEGWAEPLESAQNRKYQRLCGLLALRPGDHVLEIGCGWGGFAEVAARDYGCRVTALTLSEQQAAFARARIQRLGLAAQVDIRLQDYRDTEGRYDAVASVEMLEAVGAANWGTYFETVRRCLHPGGRAAIQTITIEDRKYENYARSADFIQRYIFPGGMLPSPSAFRAYAAAAGFSLTDELFFGAHYAETLRRWAEAFNAAWPAIADLGFDARFKRMWNYYLSYCEAGFTVKHIDVAQFLLGRKEVR
jgi:cyclopropane-fatty-acyl-phospholipid synthase